MTRKKTAIAGICIVLSYLCITLGLCIDGQSIWLTAMELITMISGLYMPVLILFFPMGSTETHNKMHKLATAFATACMICTVCAHAVSLGVTQVLVNQGVAIPEYLLIGKWPSIEMTVDYTGWGIFMGLSFLFASLAIENGKQASAIKITSLISAILCITGYLGTFLINENLWYIAPFGYGIGSLVLCVELLPFQSRSN